MKYLKWSLCLPLLIGLSLLLASRFTLNNSESEPVGLYRITSTPPHRGDLALLRNPLKRIAGVPGDKIATTPMGTMVNGVLQPNSGVSLQAPYDPYPYRNFTLAPDQFWVLGDHPLSYDSRYYGPVPGSLIASQVKPVWTTSISITNNHVEITKPADWIP